jgi:hypothetical protein
MDYVPFIYSCNGEPTYAALGVRTPHTVYPALTGGLRACPSVNMSQKIGETSLRRCSVPRIPPRLPRPPRISQCNKQLLPWEMPSEMLRYPHRAPRCFRADQMPPCVRWWNRSTASKPSSTNIVKVVRGKRYWPHLRVHYLTRVGPRPTVGTLQIGYPYAQELSKVPWCHTPHPTWEDPASPRVPWH